MPRAWRLRKTRRDSPVWDQSEISGPPSAARTSTSNDRGPEAMAASSSPKHRGAPDRDASWVTKSMTGLLIELAGERRPRPVGGPVGDAPIATPQPKGRRAHERTAASPRGRRTRQTPRVGSLPTRTTASGNTSPEPRLRADMRGTRAARVLPSAIQSCAWGTLQSPDCTSASRISHASIRFSISRVRGNSVDIACRWSRCSSAGASGIRRSSCLSRIRPVASRCIVQ